MKQKIINLIFAVFLIFVGTYFLLGEILLPPDKLDHDNVCKEYTAEWERITPDGKRETVTMPGRCIAQRNEIVIVETKLPDDIENGRYLCFRSAKQDMKFYVDGELRKEYSTKDSRLFGRMSAAAYVFVEISEDDAQKTLRAEFSTDSSYSGVFYNVYYGNYVGIWKFFFKQFGLELVVAFVTLILSIIAIIGSVAIGYCYHRRLALEYLGWGILIAAVWLITNSVFRQLIFPNLSVVNDITFFMIMLLALPYLLYMNQVQQGRYSRAYGILEGIVSINFVVCSVLHMTGICDFTDTISYISAFCIITIVLFFVTMFMDIKSKAIREYRYVAIGMLGVCVAAFVQIILYFNKNNLFNGMILSLGLIFLLLFSTISTIFEIMSIDREKQLALQANESKGRFLANMSHEIRTPIHAVLGMDAMILRESKEKQIREYALDIQNAGQTLLSLINDILDLSKIESGKLEIINAEYDLSSLIHDVVNMIGMKAKDKGLSLELSINKSLPSLLIGDDIRIRQILVNLMTNAVKYTEKGGVTLAVDGDTDGGCVNLKFEVKDTGIGIREKDLEKLFHEFERIDEKRNRKIEGTGLGMNITTRLLDMMGSRLQVESEYGRGSSFSFVLRQEIVSREPIGDLEQRLKNRADTYSYQALFNAPDAQILVVDDNAVNRRVFVKLLEATQVHIDEAGGGKECLELVKQKEYDIIFLDHMMPDMDGITVLREIREQGILTTAIALTANAVTGAKEMYLGEGFMDFLSKPVNPEKLEKMIMRYLPEEKIMDAKEVKTASAGKSEAETQEEALPELEGIDWSYAHIYCKDTAILKDIINNFYKMSEDEAAQLEQIFERINTAKSEDEQLISAYRIRVHSMKNSAAMIGAVSLSGVARMLEYAARDGKIVVIKQITPLFLEEWQHIKEVLEPLSGQKPQEEKEPADYNFIKELLHLLKDAIKDMDVDAADEIMHQLERFSYPRAITPEVMEKLSLAVTNLDEEQTEVWADKFEQNLEEDV